MRWGRDPRPYIIFFSATLNDFVGVNGGYYPMVEIPADIKQKLT